MYLSGSPKQGRWTVIEKGMPLCADTSTLENALLTFKRFADIPDLVPLHFHHTVELGKPHCPSCGRYYVL